MKNYDVISIGAGAAGVFLSYELTRIENSASVLVIDKGAQVTERVCPISAGRTDTCLKCTPCHIMNGFGGAGTLSDGIYNITTEVCGELQNYIGRDKA
ncbi:MAG: FAD-dependent oxidoreductase, partial [Anaerovoracaceae bacterium]|nr:FAD-dependent oxidoreductase [Anaerovoracaceae bacterium]